MRRLILFTLFAFFVILLSRPVSAQIKIDGVFFDWTPGMQLDTAPQTEEKTFGEGDETDPARGSTDPSYFADLDIEDVYGTDDADFVYVRVKMNQAANVLNIANDTSYHGGAAIAVYISVDPGAGDTTGLTWGWWGNGYDFLIQVYPEDSLMMTTSRYQQTVWEHKQAGTGWDFESANEKIGASVAWNSANNEVELAIPKFLLFNPRYLSNFQMPDSIAIMVYAGENNSPWRADYASNAGIAGLMMKVKEPGPVGIDGVFFDWTPGMQLDTAPQTEEKTFGEGDETDPARGSTDPSYFADLDIEDVYGTDDADFVYVRVKMNQAANVLNIANDTSYHGGAAIAVYISVDPGAGDTTGLTWGWWGNGYDFLIQVYPEDSLMQAMTGFQQPVWEHKQAGTGWDFETADTLRGSWVAWNAANNDVELAIPKSILLNPRYLTNFQVPDSIAVMVYAGENNSPWRADYASNAGIAGLKLKINQVTSVREIKTSAVPSKYALSQNYPNPFNPDTKIQYSVPKEGLIRVKVYNLLGEEIVTLVNNVQTAGTYSVDFHAGSLSSGIYFYTLESGNVREVRKMILMK